MLLDNTISMLYEDRQFLYTEGYDSSINSTVLQPGPILSGLAKIWFS